MRSTGKVAGDGKPPANEMISGRIVTFRISRIAELCNCCARCEKCHWIGVGCSIFIYVFLPPSASFRFHLPTRSLPNFRNQLDFDASAHRDLRDAECGTRVLALLAENLAD